MFLQEEDEPAAAEEKKPEKKEAVEEKCVWRSFVEFLHKFSNSSFLTVRVDVYHFTNRVLQAPHALSLADASSAQA